MDLPNIVMLLSHDTGRHIGPYGRSVATPHLDRLATEGVVFDAAFCTAPQCSPSRASLLTGLLPHSHGLVGLTHLGFRLHPTAQQRALPYLLSAHGYRTLLFGFQHEAPNARDLGYQDVDLTGAPWYRMQDVAAQAAAFLATGPVGPFFAMVGCFETHRPFEPTDTSLDGVVPLPYLPDLPDVRRDIADLNQQVGRLDRGVGQILAALDASGQADGTLFVYTTDHGIAFPGAKCTLFDPGLEISLMARGPGGFRGGRRISALVSNVDLYPTILELCGLSPPDGTDGVSLLPLVDGSAVRAHDEIFAELAFHISYDPLRGLRTDRYKYIRSFADRPLIFPTHVDHGRSKLTLLEQGYPPFRQTRPRELLFDLSRDPLEQSNRVGDLEYASTLATLRTRLGRWMTDTGDPLLHGDVPIPAGATVQSADS